MADKTQVLALFDADPSRSSESIAAELRCKGGYVRATLQRNGRKLSPKPGGRPMHAPACTPAPLADPGDDVRLAICADLDEGAPVQPTAKKWGVGRELVRSLRDELSALDAEAANG